MNLYAINKSKLNNISSLPFKSEKEIQNLVENNLKELFNLELIKSEFRVKDYRFDTLCFDRENNSFVIIEYKKDKNFTVIDQGYTYLSVMLNNKSDFILEYNEKNKIHLQKSENYWSQSRVIFISQNFSDYQLNSVNFKDAPFELWEIKRYNNNTVELHQHKSQSNESIVQIGKSKNTIVNSVAKEVQVFNEEFHLTQKNISDEIKEIFSDLKNRILGLGEIEVVSRQSYISFKRKTNVVDINFQKDKLWLWINLKKGELDDPKKLTRDVSKIGHFGNGDYDLKVDKNSDLNYVIFLIHQSYIKQEKK